LAVITIHSKLLYTCAWKKVSELKHLLTIVAHGGLRSLYAGTSTADLRKAANAHFLLLTPLS
jgi:hypothetical protein